MINSKIALLKSDLSVCKTISLFNINMARHILILITVIFFGACLHNVEAQTQPQTQVKVWTSNGANKIQQLVEGDTSDLITIGAITPWVITVDPIAGKLYWTNVTEGTIKSADLDGSNIQTILSGLDLPRGIVLDGSTNTLFWAEAGITNPGIRSVSLNEEPLVVTVIDTSTVVSPYHIALDIERQYVYWVDNASTAKQISRIKYDGSGIETVITDVYVKQVAGLALDSSGNTLYWSDFEDDLIYSADAAAEDQNVQIVYEISGDSTPWAIAVDPQSDELYWTDYLNSTIHSVSLSTSEQTEIASGISTAAGFVAFYNQEITPGSPNNFITTWKTDNSGQSEDDEITIPTDPGSIYNYDVYWENVEDSGINGMIDNNSGNLTIGFDAPGTYRVEIAGLFPRVLFFNPNASDGNQAIDPHKIETIDQWGAINWTSMEHAFHGAENLKLFATDTPNLSAVEKVSSMFFGATAFRLEGDATMNNWDVSTISIFDEMFSGATEFGGDISEWSTGNATSMNRMFNNAVSFNQTLGGWDIGQVTEMENMLTNSGLSVENYDKTLIGWNAQTIQSNVSLGADGLQYCQGDGADARQALIVENLWIITDSGLADNCIPTRLELDENVPIDFSLEQNYPNPFNPSTLITFDLPSAGQVRITIYDLTGRTVKTLVDNSFSAGRHQIKFDASQLSSGVYLYRLETPGMTATRKMMLVK